MAQAKAHVPEHAGPEHAGPEHAGPERAGPGRAYSFYVLALLTLVYAFNWLDRYIFTILMEPIKQELKLSDTELGFLSGFAFSLIYAVAGIGIARWADVASRRSIIAGGLAVWSAMTGVCGLAGNFLHLFLGRIGVGLGEAACSPPSHSLISDYFPGRTRGRAFAVHGLGLYLGMAAGLIIGGVVNQYYGWRAAFFVAGVPGILLALLFRLTVREPVRGGQDEGHVDAAPYSLREAVGRLAKMPSFLSYAIGIGLFSFAANAVNVWATVYFMRVQGIDSAHVGWLTGTVGGAAGLSGTLAFGFLADWLGRRDVRWYLWVPSLAILVLLPATMLMLFSGGTAMVVGYFLAMAMGASCLAPAIAVTQRLMPVRMRALASSLLLLGLNLIGIGAGTFVAGLFNDLFEPRYGIDAIRHSLTLTTAIGVVTGLVFTLFGAARLRPDLAANGTEPDAAKA